MTQAFRHSMFLLLGVALIGGCSSRAQKDPAIPAGIQEDEKGRFQAVSGFLQGLPPDAMQVEQEIAAQLDRLPTPDDKALFLTTILRLQFQIDTEEHERERMMAAWSAARRLLRGQGVAALRTIVFEIRRTGGNIPGVEEVLIGIGPSAGRLLLEILQEPYPVNDRKEPHRREREVRARGLFVHALGKIASPASRSPLEQVFLKDAEDSLRYAARDAIVRMRAQRIVNTVCAKYLASGNALRSEFARSFLVEVYGLKPSQGGYGRNPDRWLAAFDNAYHQMNDPIDKLLDCFNLPEHVDEKKVPALEFAKRVLADATGRDFKEDALAWSDHFRREDQELVRLLVQGLSDKNLVNRDAVREDLVRVTRGQDFAYKPQEWIEGLTQIGWFKEPEKK